MGKVGDVLKAVTLGGQIYETGQALINPKEPKTASELERKAEKEAEKKRLARSSSKEKFGKTVFTSPTGVAGMPLKKKLGE
jgi:hypothetical protein